MLSLKPFRKMKETEREMRVEKKVMKRGRALSAVIFIAFSVEILASSSFFETSRSISEL
jgi:hypothetical protein